MVYIVWAILGILSFVNKKNRYITALLFVFISIIFCFNTANPDLQHYRTQYDGIRIYATEPIFNFFNNLFYRAGVSYEVFRSFLAIVSLGLITFTFYKLTPYPTLALFMYSIYPMVIDVVQIRYTISYAIVFYSLLFLVRYQDTHNKKDAAFFFVGILIATGFHYVVALFAVLGLLLLDIKKHRIIYLILIPLTVIVGVLAIDRFAPIIGNIIGVRKTDLWVVAERNSSILRICRILINRGLPLMFSVFLSIILKNWEFIHVIRSNTGSIGLINPNYESFYQHNCDPKNYYNIKMNSCLFLCMFYVWLFSILEITIAGDYERLARLGLLIGTVLLTRQIFYLEKSNKRITSALFLTIYILYFIMIMFFMKNNGGELYIDYVFRQVMESNSIFGVTYQ